MDISNLQNPQRKRILERSEGGDVNKKLKNENVYKGKLYIVNLHNRSGPISISGDLPTLIEHKQEMIEAVYSGDKQIQNLPLESLYLLNLDMMLGTEKNSQKDFIKNKINLIRNKSKEGSGDLISLGPKKNKALFEDFIKTTGVSSYAVTLVCLRQFFEGGSFHGFYQKLLLADVLLMPPFDVQTVSPPKKHQKREKEQKFSMASKSGTRIPERDHHSHGYSQMNAWYGKGMGMEAYGQENGMRRHGDAWHEEGYDENIAQNQIIDLLNRNYFENGGTEGHCSYPYQYPPDTGYESHYSASLPEFHLPLVRDPLAQSALQILVQEGEEELAATEEGSSPSLEYRCKISHLINDEAQQEEEDTLSESENQLIQAHLLQQDPQRWHQQNPMQYNPGAYSSERQMSQYLPCNSLLKAAISLSNGFQQQIEHEQSPVPGTHRYPQGYSDSSIEIAQPDFYTYSSRSNNLPLPLVNSHISVYNSAQPSHSDSAPYSVSDHSSPSRHSLRAVLHTN